MYSRDLSRRYVKTYTASHPAAPCGPAIIGDSLRLKSGLPLLCTQLLLPLLRYSLSISESTSSKCFSDVEDASFFWCLTELVHPFLGHVRPFDEYDLPLPLSSTHLFPQSQVTMLLTDLVRCLKPRSPTEAVLP